MAFFVKPDFSDKWDALQEYLRIVNFNLCIRKRRDRMADIIGIGEALNSKVAEKAYDDILSKPAKQAGEFTEDFLKVIRLLSFPVQLAAAVQDKFKRMLTTAFDAVPQERRIDLQPQTIPSILQIAGPIYEHTKYIDENGILYELFEELLARSVDSERISEAHPSFIHIISQLSHDEAILLYELKKRYFEIVDTLDFDDKKGLWSNLKIESNTIPKDELMFPNNYEMYIHHLDSLGLVKWPIIKQDPILDGPRQIGTRRNSKIHLTEFGKFFVNACVPEGGFKNIGGEKIKTRAATPL
jgi:hypothetical protein